MTHPVDIHVGRKLKTLRLLRGLTQTDVAKALNISFQQVQKYELGRNRISASKLHEVAKILHVAPAHFFEGLDGTPDASLPILDEETAAIAALFAQIADPNTKAQFRSLAQAVIQSQPAPALAAE